MSQGLYNYQTLFGEWSLPQTNWQMPSNPFSAGTKFMQFRDVLKSDAVNFDIVKLFQVSSVKLDLKLQIIDYSALLVQVLPLQPDDG